MKESLAIKLLYGTVIGRLLLRLLANPVVSRRSAAFFGSPVSSILIPVFVRLNGIDLSGYEMPGGGYSSFNDFFTRKRKDENVRIEDGALISPCDAFLTVSDITEDSVFHIKHTHYSLRELLKSDRLAERFRGGTAFIFRLTPAHYHRYVWSVSGSVAAYRLIPGLLHSVQPICHEKYPVFVENTRKYSLIKSEAAGTVIQMEIGGMLVGKISNYRIWRNQTVRKGDYKGFFEYGGSSIVVLSDKKCELPPAIKNRKKVGSEIPVVIGEKLN